MNLQLIIDKLADQQRREFLVILKKELGETPQLDKVRSKINKNQKVIYPHGSTNDIYGHGTYKGRKKYKCKHAVRRLMTQQSLG